MVPEADRATYYRAALCCLRFIEQRRPTGRRFGPEADARWVSFRGELQSADRIDLLLRDADAQWPGALGACTVFGLRAVAEDEPFGAGWEPLDPVDAEELWRQLLAEQPPVMIRDTLVAMAAAWRVPLAPHNPGPITATDRLVVAGPSAIAAVIAACADSADLDWAEQVVCVATPPAHRQLAAVASALLDTARPTRLRATAIPEAPDGPDVAPLPGHRLLVSDDVDATDLALARRLASQ
jgi:hypothetical protein